MDDKVDQEAGQTEKKEERVDELDVMGGLLIKFFQNIISFLKNRNKPQV